METHGATISVHDQSQVGDARRQAMALAGSYGFDSASAGRVAIAATEAARNLCLHGGGGELVLTPMEWRSQPCLEILALDSGSGMQDVKKCMRDGYSTTGTPGTGLGAIERLADDFDVYSAPGKGTVLMARFLARRASVPHPDPRLEFSAMCIADSREEVCGDGWAYEPLAAGGTFVVADGLGHGEFAKQASQEALRVFRHSAARTPTEILEHMHAALRSTRGAAVSLARIDLQQKTVVFAGVGNISAAIISNGSCRSMVSLNGTVGHEIRKIQEFSYPWSEDSLLIMHSDGLGTRWDLDSYAGLRPRAPGVIAGVLYRDFSRRRDDVTVLVVRETLGQKR